MSICSDWSLFGLDLSQCNELAERLHTACIRVQAETLPVVYIPANYVHICPETHPSLIVCRCKISVSGEVEKK